MTRGFIGGKPRGKSHSERGRGIRAGHRAFTKNTLLKRKKQIHRLMYKK